ncbi:MAG: hypothetical protein RIB98_10910 [Acidimicrobiales bacterium]
MDETADVESAREKHDLAIAAELAHLAIAEFAAQGDPFLVRHTVQLTSFGGSGTTALTRVFVDAALDLPRGPAQWPHKHLRRPPSADAVPPGFRVVYPLSDPRDAVLSIFRRGIQEGHWRGLHSTEPDTPAPGGLADLHTFLAGGVDEFGLADHVDGWRRHPAGYPVMFVRFDRIDEAWDDLAAFVGLPEGHPRLAYESRRSDWRSAAPDTRDGVDAMYGELASQIDSMPPAVVI